MRKALTLAILGTALVASVGAQAQTTPAFIGATACEAAAPLRTEAVATHRAVSTHRPDRAAGARGTARAEQRHAARPAGRPAKAGADQTPTEAEVPERVEEGPVLRRALHFCVGTPGARRSWMT